MGAFYRCPRHGQFPITDVYKCDSIELFKLAKKHRTLPCPKCGTVCKACKRRKASA